MGCKDRITIDQAVLVGKPVIKGTRIAVAFVIDLWRMAGPSRKFSETIPVLRMKIFSLV